MPRASRLRDALGEGYATRGGRERGTLRAVLTDELVEFTRDPCATMRWTVDRFYKHIFLRYSAKLVGWPPHIWFENLSKVSMPTSTVNFLLQCWEKGVMRWETPTSDEMAAAAADWRKASPSPLFSEQAVRYGRNDIGKHCKRPMVDCVRFPPCYARDGPKNSDETEDADAAWGVYEQPEDPIDDFSD
ncbi:hypothetical protein C8Q73DRAFT_793501 [Cubamyces lactineus]|nr:hypothetical protein C8Q73DRAFT_793499 [Cubamyces lactineus]KAH9889288.1 hypothetical protein C8Q73DRAFT_793501 [Cubamyces lactineus]